MRKVVTYKLCGVHPCTVVLVRQLAVVVVPPIPVLAQPRNRGVPQPRVVLVLVELPLNEQQGKLLACEVLCIEVNSSCQRLNTMDPCLVCHHGLTVAQNGTKHVQLGRVRWPLPVKVRVAAGAVGHVVAGMARV